jgi:hypothetical protein
MEVMMVTILGLSLYQQDAPTRDLNNVLIFNVLITQPFKRFLRRQRPGQQMPPRSEQLFKTDSSSFPSRTLVSATTFIFTALTCNNWTFNLQFLNGIEFWIVILITVGTFILVSFTRVHLG